jgi:hypothetical protein
LNLLDNLRKAWDLVWANEFREPAQTDRALILCDETLAILDAQIRPRTRRVPSVNPKMKARDKWIYRKCCAGIAYDQIIAELKKVAFKRGWQIISSKQRVQQIGKEYAEKNERPPPPPRRRQ